VTDQEVHGVDVTKMLEADHRQVEALFGQIERAEGAERQSLVDELATSLRAHMELEEAVVYPKLGPITGQEEVQEAQTEHSIARKGLDQLMQLSPDEPGVGAALDALKGGIEHHVHDEEDEVFPKLRKDGADTLAAMATPFMTKRFELGMPMDADALAEASTKDELAEEARAAGLEGTSSMSKAELASALAEHMAGSRS
jgi:hemerythrin superfamily protein